MHAPSQVMDDHANLFVNAPIHSLEQDLLPLFLERRLQPEIGLESPVFWEWPISRFRRLAASLAAEGLRCTVHAPFWDLAPGGYEPRILALTRDKLARTVEIAALFRPVDMVCHLGWEPWRYGHDPDRWLETACTTFLPVLEEAAAQGWAVVFENTYEPDPAMHLRFLQRLHHVRAGFCLDCGHLLAFAKTADFAGWLLRLAPYLGHVHVHDNDGRADRHLAPGSGIFPFDDLFRWLEGRGLHPVLTLEPHSPADLELAVARMAGTPLWRRACLGRRRNPPKFPIPVRR